HVALDDGVAAGLPDDAARAGALADVDNLDLGLRAGVLAGALVDLDGGGLAVDGELHPDADAVARAQADEDLLVALADAGDAPVHERLLGLGPEDVLPAIAAQLLHLAEEDQVLAL